MKNYIKSGLLMGLLTLSACNDELEKEPIGLVTQDQVDTTPTLAIIETSVSNSYRPLSNTLNIYGDWNWTGGMVFQNDYVLQDIASDDMQKKWIMDGDQPWMDDIDNYNFTSINGGPNGLWKYNYQGIKQANQSIDMLTNPDIETITGITTDVKNRRLGECYFLRAYYYFSLVTNFERVALITQPIRSYQEAFDFAVQVDPQLVWDQINTDLTAAKDLLPDSKYSDSAEKWRASKAAVLALMAKTKLYKENWNEIPAIVDQIAGLGYSLNGNYFDSFRTEFTDNEVIFAFDHQNNQTPRRGNGICAPLGWGFFAPTQSFLDEFEANDPRLLYTVDVEHQNVNKMLGTLNGDNKGNDDASNNKIYVRFADVLLWKAEALLESGDYNGAIAIINQVRQRARNGVDANGNAVPAGTLPDRPASTDAATVKNWLIHERRVELGFENQRMLDLKRWGIAQEVMQANGKNFQPQHRIYPIPQSEIDASAGTLTQNPGY